MRLNTLLTLAVALVLFTLTLAAPSYDQPRCEPYNVDTKNRVFVLSDISNEPDDTMSFVRLLLHSDQYQIEGLVAVTSYWQNASVYPDQIEAVVKAYGEVVDNLQTHGHGQFPSEEYLLGRIRSGPTTYGMATIDALRAGGNVSSGAQLLIDSVDASDSRLYVQVWGGVNTLAEALWQVNQSRSPAEFAEFTAKLSVYAISDQDNTGAWLRREFPSVRYIASVHGWNFYGLAAWTGISGELYYGFDKGGPDTSLVTNDWVHGNVQLGALGKMYPNITFIMEGDSPSIFFTMQNGLNAPEHPEWGGWGGRYFPVNYGEQQFSDAADHAIGQNGQEFISNHATVWRWRSAYQNEMAARIQWTLRGNEPRSNTTHPPVVAVNGSCGSAPIELDVAPDSTITLDASQSYDRDGRSLNFTWFHYREITATQWWVSAEVPQLNFTAAAGSDGRVVNVHLPQEANACRAPTALHATGPETCQQYHAILQVTNSGTPPITRYRRVILKVRPSNSTSAGA